MTDFWGKPLTWKKRGRTGSRITRVTRRGRTRRATPQMIGNVEVKFVDVETSNDAFANTWSTMEDATNDSVSGVTQGIGESQRIGRKYTIESIHIHALAHIAASESITNPQSAFRGRICLVQDTQTNGVQLTATDVMDGGQTNDFLAFRNLQFTKRFRVIWDKSFVITPVGQTNEGAVNLFANGTYTTGIMKFNKAYPKGIPVLCDGTDATISSITDNSFHVIGVANSTAVLLDYQVRVRYTG